MTRGAKQRRPTDAGRPAAGRAGRLDVRKTYKLFVGGAFPRSESGRSYRLERSGGAVVHVSRASRKDLREAVRAARGAQPGWSGRSAYNRGQVLYRVAEVMESRRAEFAVEVRAVGGRGGRAAAREVDRAIDRWVWYAGWADKYGPLLGGVNPVSGPYYDFTVPEPMGVVGVVAPEASPLLGLVSRLAPVLVSGNTAVVLASHTNPLPAVALAETLATSDVPAGTVNVLTGLKAELVPVLAAHMDVNAVDAAGAEPDELEAIELASAGNLKRVRRPAARADWFADEAQSPYLIGDFTEFKTVWHPVGT
ncbi:MAG: aldehyde dehydrogenase family protein [Gemmatimonadota bacterium]